MGDPVRAVARRVRPAVTLLVALVLVVAGACSGGSSAKGRADTGSSSAASSGASSDSGSTDTASTDTGSDASGLPTDTGSSDSTISSGDLGRTEPIASGFRPADVVEDGRGGFVTVGTEDGHGAAYAISRPGARWGLSGSASAIDEAGVEPVQAVPGDNGDIVAVGTEKQGDAPATAIFLLRRGGSRSWEREPSDLDKAGTLQAIVMRDVTYDGDGYIAVGSQQNIDDATSAEVDPTTAKPLVETTGNGTKWTASTVPLPDGAVGGLLFGITVTPQGSAYPGLVAVGEAFYPQAAPASGYRRTATVWHSDDGGFTWAPVSDPANFEGDSELSTLKVVAADGSDIVAAGVSAPKGATTDSSGVIQLVAAYWRIRPGETTWTRTETNAEAGKDSSVEFLEPEGGKLIAAELTNPTGGSLDDGTTTTYSTDGSQFDDLTLADNPERLLGLAGADGYFVVVGLDRSGGGAAWITRGDTG